MYNSNFNSTSPPTGQISSSDFSSDLALRWPASGPMNRRYAEFGLAIANRRAAEPEFFLREPPARRRSLLSVWPLQPALPHITGTGQTRGTFTVPPQVNIGAYLPANQFAIPTVQQIPTSASINTVPPFGQFQPALPPATVNSICATDMAFTASTRKLIQVANLIPTSRPESTNTNIDQSFAINTTSASPYNAIITDEALFAEFTHIPMSNDVDLAISLPAPAPLSTNPNQAYTNAPRGPPSTSPSMQFLNTPPAASSMPAPTQNTMAANQSMPMNVAASFQQPTPASDDPRSTSLGLRIPLQQPEIAAVTNVNSPSLTFASVRQPEATSLNSQSATVSPFTASMDTQSSQIRPQINRPVTNNTYPFTAQEFARLHYNMKEMETINDNPPSDVNFIESHHRIGEFIPGTPRSKHEMEFFTQRAESAGYARRAGEVVPSWVLQPHSIVSSQLQRRYREYQIPQLRAKSLQSYDDTLRRNLIDPAFNPPIPPLTCQQTHHYKRGPHGRPRVAIGVAQGTTLESTRFSPLDEIETRFTSAVGGILPHSMRINSAGGEDLSGHVAGGGNSTGIVGVGMHKTVSEGGAMDLDIKDTREFTQEQTGEAERGNAEHETMKEVKVAKEQPTANSANGKAIGNALEEGSDVDGDWEEDVDMVSPNGYYSNGVMSGL